jgi:hypothetical protein
MPTIDELLIQLIGPEGEGGEAAAKALEHSHGIEATFMAHMLVLQKKKKHKRLAFEDVILRGYAHHQFRLDVIAQRESREAWLASMRRFVHSREEFVADEVVPYLDTTTSMETRFAIIEHACRSLKVLLKQTVSDIDQLAIASCLFRIGQAQWIEVQRGRRYSAFSKLEVLATELKWFVDFRDRIRHPKGRPFDNILQDAIAQLELKKLQNLEYVCEQAREAFITDQPLWLEPQDANDDNDAAATSSAEVSMQLEEQAAKLRGLRTMAKKILDGLKRKFSESPDNALLKQSISVLESVMMTFTYQLEIEPDMVFNPQKQIENLVLLSITQENTHLLCPNFTGILPVSRWVDHDSNVKTLLGKALCISEKINADFIWLCFFQGKESHLVIKHMELLDDLVYIMRSARYSTAELSGSQLIPLMNLLLNDLHAKKISGFDCQSLWYQILTLPISSSPMLDNIHLTCLRLVFRQHKKITKEEQAASLLKFIGSFGWAIHKDLMSSMLDLTLDYINQYDSEESRSRLMRWMFIYLTDVGYNRSDLSHVDERAMLQLAFPYRTVPVQALQYVLAQSMIQQYLLSITNRCSEQQVGPLRVHPFILCAEHWDEMFIRLQTPVRLARTRAEHQQAVKYLSRLRVEMNLKLIMLWKTFSKPADFYKPALLGMMLKYNAFDSFVYILQHINWNNEQDRDAVLLLTENSKHVSSPISAENIVGTMPASWGTFQKTLKITCRQCCNQTSLSVPRKYIKNLKQCVVKLKSELDELYNNIVESYKQCKNLSFESDDSGGGGAAADVPRRSRSYYPELASVEKIVQGNPEQLWMRVCEMPLSQRFATLKASPKNPKASLEPIAYEAAIAVSSMWTTQKVKVDPATDPRFAVDSENQSSASCRGYLFHPSVTRTKDEGVITGELFADQLPVYVY